jgi:hypothetical protein
MERLRAWAPRAPRPRGRLVTSWPVSAGSREALSRIADPLVRLGSGPQRGLADSTASRYRADQLSVAGDSLPIGKIPQQAEAA